MGRYNLHMRTTVEVVMTDWHALSRGNCQTFNARIGMIDDASPDDRTKSYGWKLPVKSDGTPFIYRDSNTTPSDDQANVDEILLQAKNAGGTVYAGFWWPDDSLITDGHSNWNIQSSVRLKLRAMYQRFRTSVNKLNKFCIHTGSLLSAWDSSASAPLPPPANTGGTWGNFTNFLNSWIAEAQDPAYWHTPADARSPFPNRPILMLFQDATPTWDAARITTVRNAFTGAGLNNPFILMNTIAACTACGADGTYNYCGPNKTAFGTTHRPWTDEGTHLESFFSESVGGTVSLPSVCFTNDGRPRAENDVDPATYIEGEKVIRHARDFALSQIRPQILQAILVANLGEYDESSVIGATPQTRLLGPRSHRGLMLDIMQNVLEHQYPAPVWVAYQGRSLHTDITRVNWATLVQNLTNGGGAHQYEELQTSSAGATYTIAPALACDRVVVYSSKGPSYGTMNGATDGGASTLCTQTNGSIVRTYNDPPDVGPTGLHLGSPAYDTGVLSPGLHSVVMTQASGTVGIDLVLVHITATR